MRNLPTVCLCTLGSAAALLAACKPQAVDPQRLAEMQKLNQDLSRQIVDMEASIRRAGDDVPNLAEDITARQQDIAEQQRLLTAKQDEIHNLNVNLIRLRDRLSEFRDTFSEMQNSVANQTPRS